MDQQTLDRVQNLLDYRFRDSSALLEEALLAPGAGKVVRGQCLLSGNKRLALLGQGIISLSVMHFAYVAGSDKETTSRLLAFHTSQARLAQLAQDSSLDIYIRPNPAQGNVPISPLARCDAIKAVLAAVWFDCGKDLDTCNRVARTLGLAVENYENSP